MDYYFESQNGRISVFRAATHREPGTEEAMVSLAADNESSVDFAVGFTSADTEDQARRRAESLVAEAIEAKQNNPRLRWYTRTRNVNTGTGTKNAGRVQGNA